MPSSWVLGTIDFFTLVCSPVDTCHTCRGRGCGLGHLYLYIEGPAVPRREPQGGRGRASGPGGGWSSTSLHPPWKVPGAAMPLPFCPRMDPSGLGDPAVYHREPELTRSSSDSRFATECSAFLTIAVHFSCSGRVLSFRPQFSESFTYRGVSVEKEATPKYFDFFVRLCDQRQK